MGDLAPSKHGGVLLLDRLGSVLLLVLLQDLVWVEVLLRRLLLVIARGLRGLHPALERWLVLG